MALSKEKMKEEEEKFKQGFMLSLKKLDVSNQVKQRISGIKELDQLIEKRIQKIIKNQVANGTFSGGTNTGTGIVAKGAEQGASGQKNKIDFPLCLSTIIVKIQDLIQNKDVKKEQRQEIDHIVLLCFQQQKCLIYKFPFFMLNFIEQNLELKDKLHFLKFLTNDGLEIDGVFNSKLFIILAKMLDPQLKIQCMDTLYFLRNIFDYNPKAFTEFQTLSLLIRMSLVSISGLNNGQSDHSLEILQILQYLLKYNDYSQKLLNISLLTICILATREPMTSPAWNIVRLLIWQNPRQVIQELIEILNIGDTLHQQSFRGSDVSSISTSSQSMINTPISREIQYRCFKESSNQLIMELEDLDQSNPVRLNNNNTRISLYELICQNQCSHKYMNTMQSDEIQRLERSQYKQYEKMYLPNFLKTLEIDRNQLVKTFEKHLDRVKKGAIYFISMALWGYESLDTYKYPFNQILKMFKNLAIRTTKFNILNHIMMAVKQLLIKKHQELYLAWDTILEIMEIMAKHQDIFMKKKATESITEIFRVIRNDILIGNFSGDEGKALRIYQIYRQGGTVTCKTMSSLYIEYCFQNDFMNMMSPLIEQCLINEKNSDFRILFLDKLQDFYENQEDINNMCIIESIFSNILEHFYNPISPLTNQYQTFSTVQQIQIIDILSYMAHKTQKMSNFKHIMSILVECVNYCDIDRNLLPVTLEAQSTVQVNRLKIAIQNAQGLEALKMKAQQQHALSRMIQLFRLKSQSIEFEKSIFIYNSLISILKFSINDRRTVICDDLLKHIRINVNREVCWESEDNPLFVNIYNMQFPSESIYHADQVDDRQSHSNQSQGSSGNSGSPGISSYLQLREIGSLLGDRPQQKVQSDEQISILSTLQSLMHCVEDVNSTIDLKRSCLQVFLRYCIFLQESDLQVPLESDQDVQINVAQTVKEWYRIIEQLILQYQPLFDQELAFLIIDIFYALLGMQNYSQPTPILNKYTHIEILELLIKTIEISIEYLLIGQNDQKDQMMGFESVGKKGMLSQTDKNKPMMQKQNTKAFKSFATPLDQSNLLQGQTNTSIFESDDPKVKQALKMCKKAISILGFSFNFDILDGGSLWFEGVHGQINYFVTDQKYKLIAYLIEQFMVICLNDQLMSKLSHYISICISNIVKALHRFKETMNDQILVDHLIFICLKIGFTNVLDNKCVSDPIERKKQNLNLMQQSLRLLLRGHFGIDEQKLMLDQYYVNDEYIAFNMHSIIYNLSQLFELNSQEETLRLIQTLFDQRQFNLNQLLKNRKADSNSAMQNYQFLTENVIACISHLFLWQAHSQYDRECNLKIIYQQSKSKFHHFLWDKNLITILNKARKMEVIIRNPVYNYRTQIKTINKVHNKQSFGANEYSSIKQILKGNDGDQMKGQIKEEDQSQNHSNPNLPVQIDEMTKYLLNDITVMGIIDPTLLNKAKVNKEFTYFEDSDQIRNQINFLDTICPKDIYQCGIIYVPKKTKLSDITQFKDLFRHTIQQKYISENHVKFLSCLGRVCKAKDYPEYLEQLTGELQESSIIVNQDSLSFVTYFSNILLKEGLNDKFLSNLFEKVWIIYNESTIECFSHLSQDKIFLIITKLKQGYYRLEIQHNRNNQLSGQFQDIDSIQKSERNRQSSFYAPRDTIKINKYQPMKSNTDNEQFEFLDGGLHHSNSQTQQQQPQQQMQFQEQEDDYKSNKFNNGHISSQAIIKEEHLGVFLKNFVILTDILERKQRFGKDALCSNIIARCFKIHEIKEKIGRQGHNISIIKN